MNKITLLLLFICININHVTAQDRITVILDSLSVKERKVNTKIKDHIFDYLTLLKSKQNFHLKGKDVVYIKSYEQFSIFQIFSEGTLRHKKSSIVDKTPKLALLFDNEINRSFLIKYQSFSVYENISKTKSHISSSFSKNIGGVIALGHSLEPESIAIFNILSDPVNGYETGDILGYSHFNENNKIPLNAFMGGELNIEKITYSNLIKILSGELKSSNEKKYIIEVDKNNLFGNDPVFFQVLKINH